MTSPWNQPNYGDPNDFDDVDDDGGGKKPNPVRDRLRKLEKENRELKEANEKASAQLRQSSIETVLREKGYSSKVASLVPKDIEPTAEAVDKWLGDYADLFAPAPAEGKEGEGEESSEGSGEESPESAASTQAMNRIGQATGTASTPGKQADIAARLADPDLTRDELIKMIETAGGGVGSG